MKQSRSEDYAATYEPLKIAPFASNPVLRGGTAMVASSSPVSPASPRCAMTSIAASRSRSRVPVGIGHSDDDTTQGVGECTVSARAFQRVEPKKFLYSEVMPNASPLHLTAHQVMHQRRSRARGKRALFTVSALLVMSLAFLDDGTTAPAANGNYTVVYNANPNQHQGGAVTGSAPAQQVVTPGGTITVATQGALVRQGFIFGGWTTTSAGPTLAAGSTLMITSDVTLSAQWEIPVAARLFGRTSGGSRTEVVSTVSAAPSVRDVRGITTNGRSVFFMPHNGGDRIREVGFDGVFIADHVVTGAPGSLLGSDQRDLTMSSGYIFVRGGDGPTFSAMYAIDTTTWAMSQVTLPASKPLLFGQTWLSGNLVDFPDGRIGAVSANNQTIPSGTGAGQCPTGFHCKILRLYSVSESAAPVTLDWDEDIILADTESGWPADDHGIATDGTYLYQSRHETGNVGGYKVFALQSGSPSYVVFNGSDTGACGADTGISGGLCSLLVGGVTNATYFARDHVNNRYLMGDYGGPRFVYTESTVPPPGPGTAPEAPTITNATRGNGSVLTQFNTPASYSSLTITNYEYSINGGNSWTAFSPVATGSPATITGLNDSLVYPIAVRAVTANNGRTIRSLGSNIWNLATVGATVNPGPPPAIPPALSEITTLPVTTTPSTPTTAQTTVPTPVTRPDGTPPQLAPGDVTVTEANDAVVVERVVDQDDTLVLRTADFELRLSAVCQGDCGIAVDPAGRQIIELEQSGAARVAGSGFQPGSRVDVWLFSDPRYLGSVTVTADGRFDATMNLGIVDVGEHTLQVNGLSVDDVARTANIGIVVRAAVPATNNDVQLPRTGGDSDGVPAALTMLGLGLVAVLITRRRYITMR